MGNPQEPGRPCRLRSRIRSGDRSRKPRRTGGASLPAASEQATQERYRQAKETKCGGMGSKESECLIVLMTQGNLAQETLSREGGIGMYGTVEGKDAGNTEFR